MVINILRQEINNLEAPKMKNGQDLLLRFCPSMFFGPTTENPSIQVSLLCMAVQVCIPDLSRGIIQMKELLP